MLCWMALLVSGVCAKDISKATDFPCFERDIQPVLAQKCLACHYRGEEDLRGYEKAKLHSYGILREILAGNMPMREKLPEAEREMFKSWHEKGAPQCRESIQPDRPTIRKITGKAKSAGTPPATAG